MIECKNCQGMGKAYMKDNWNPMTNWWERCKICKGFGYLTPEQAEQAYFGTQWATWLRKLWRN